MSQKANLIVDQGATFDVTLNLENDDGTAFDLSNYAGDAQLRKYYTSASNTDFTVTLGGANGTIRLQLSAALTANLADGKYVYDVNIQHTTSNAVIRVLEGTVTVTPQVTR